MHSDDPFEEFLRERSILSPSSQPSPSIADAKAQAVGVSFISNIFNLYY